jgi:hypothetical protein
MIRWLLIILILLPAACSSTPVADKSSRQHCKPGESCTVTGRLQLFQGEPAWASIVETEGTCVKLALPDDFYANAASWRSKTVTVIGRAFLQPSTEGALSWYAEGDRRLAAGICDHGLGLYVQTLSSGRLVWP